MNHTRFTSVALGVLTLAVLGGCASSKPTAPTAYDFVMADAQRREQAVSTEPSVATQGNRAQTRVDVSIAQFEIGNFERAAEAAQEAISLDNQNAAAWLMAALSQERLKQDRRLVTTSYEKALRRFPSNPDIQHNFGVFLCQQDDTRRQGFELLSSAAQNPQNRSTARTWLASAKCTSDTPVSIELTRKALDVAPRWGEAWLTLGEAYAKERRWDAAHYALSKYFSFSEIPSTSALEVGIAVANARHDTFQANQYTERLKTLAPHRTFVQ
jgi:type IV pilus assembly protein PilF